MSCYVLIIESKTHQKALGLLWLTPGSSELHQLLCKLLVLPVSEGQGEKNHPATRRTLDSRASL